MADASDGFSGSGVFPFVQPFLHALNRMQARETLRPAQLTERARALLNEYVGHASEPIEAAFAHGCVGLMSEHTHFFNGFALMMPLARGTAVAVRSSKDGVSRVVFEDDHEVQILDLSQEEADGNAELTFEAQVLRQVVQDLCEPDVAVELAVVTTLYKACHEARLAALVVAAARAVQALFAFPHDTVELIQSIQPSVATAARRPFSLAYLLAAEAGRPHTYLLVDTDKMEHIAIDAPSEESLGWGMVDVQVPFPKSAFFFATRVAETEEALAILQEGAFPDLKSFRDLDHASLQDALHVLPEALRPRARYLVGENKRVPRLVFAIRHQDWQMLGALLLISQAAQRKDWEGTFEEEHVAIDVVEQMSTEGMYGATRTGSGSCVLVVGQPFTVPEALDRAKTAVTKRFGQVPAVTLL